ncbi:MAG: signal peptidase II [Vicinamibacterales bacterium]
MVDWSGRGRLEFWLPLLVIALDQATKLMVRAAIPLYESIEIIPGLLNFTHVRNTGAAFGLLNAADIPYKTVLISLIAGAGFVGIALYSMTLPRDQVMARAGLALVLGGAAGNLIDRMIEGSVVDFVDVYWGQYHFWAFNVADSAITVGVSVMLLDMLLAGARVSKAA